MRRHIVRVPSLETGAPYNLCIRHGDLIFIAGLPPFDAEFSGKLRDARANGTPVPPFPDLTFERQVEIVMDNLKTLMEAAGSNMECLLSASAKDLTELPGVGKVLAERVHSVLRGGSE